jgi:hypothetical protein
VTPYDSTSRWPLAGPVDADGAALLLLVLVVSDGGGDRECVFGRLSTSRSTGRPSRLIAVI